MLVLAMRRGDRPSGIKRAKPPSAKTVRNVVGNLAGMLAYAERKGWAKGNPARAVDLRAPPSTEEIRWLDPEEVHAAAAPPVQTPGPRDVRHGRDDRAAAGRARRAALPGHRLDGRRDPRPPHQRGRLAVPRPRHGRGPGPCGDPAPDAQRRSRPPGSTRRTASTTCGTRSAPGWRPTACRCGRCRSGWGTPASRPRSGMPTTRLGTTSGSLCRTRSRDP